MLLPIFDKLLVILNAIGLHFLGLFLCPPASTIRNLNFRTKLGRFIKCFFFLSILIAYGYAKDILGWVNKSKAGVLFVLQELKLQSFAFEVNEPADFFVLLYIFWQLYPSSFIRASVIRILI